MAEYRRWFVPGATYFFTVVTQGRRPIFSEPMAARWLGEAMREVRRARPFRTVAAALLPDHLHCLGTLPAGDADFPTRWRRIKEEFTRRRIAAGHDQDAVSTARAARGERGVWQRRYWEHLVRDENDLERHVDYLVYNPVKHGLAARPVDWPWSSIHRFIREGRYPWDWCPETPPTPKSTPAE